MASITTRKDGSRLISFVDTAKKRKHVTLGRVPKWYAESLKPKIEDLCSARILGHSPHDDTTRWLRDQSDEMYNKLAQVGLVEPRQNVTLKEWIDVFLLDRDGELKPARIRKLKQTAAKLLMSVDGSLPLRTINHVHAVDFRQALKDQNLSEAMIKTHSGNAKTILNMAVHRKLIAENPFAALKSGPTASNYTRYITPKEIDRVIDACPNAEWKLLFGLARYAGLRVPSESHLLTWQDVSFDQCRLTVHSPKTERHKGHEKRIVPITPKLMELLLERYSECSAGEKPVEHINGKGAVIRQVRRIWAQAGVEPWKRLWQTLRQSCEKHWAENFP